MLYLNRRAGEAVIINNAIEVRVVEVRGKAVRLGFRFPAEASVLRSEAEARSLAEEIGFPMVLKPPAGMGGKATFRVQSVEELLSAVRGMRVGPDAPVLAEEMLRGR